MKLNKPAWIVQFESKISARLPIHPNAVSFAKAVLAAPVFLLGTKQIGIFPNHPLIVLGGLILYGLFDYFEGIFAEYKKKYTVFGHYFNGIADYGIIFLLCLLSYELLPEWIVIIKLLLDLLVLVLNFKEKRISENRIWNGINYATLFALLIVSQSWSVKLINPTFTAYLLWLNISFSTVILLIRINLLQKKHIADALSFANLLCGVFSMIFAYKFRVDISLFFLMLGAAFDGFDGAAARKYGGTRWGVYSDDIADGVNYGIAPGVALVLVIGGSQGLIAGLVYSIFTVSRLIFFTMNKDYSDPNYFCGVPSTIGALLTLCSLILFKNQPLLIGLVVGIACIQMISFDTHHRHLGRVLASNRRIIYGMPILIILLLVGDFFMDRMVSVSLIFLFCLGYGFLPTLNHFRQLVERKRGVNS